jgi:hypothetical protein
MLSVLHQCVGQRRKARNIDEKTDGWKFAFKVPGCVVLQD